MNSAPLRHVLMLRTIRLAFPHQLPSIVVLGKFHCFLLLYLWRVRSVFALKFPGLRPPRPGGRHTVPSESSPHTVFAHQTGAGRTLLDPSSVGSSPGMSVQ